MVQTAVLAIQVHFDRARPFLFSDLIHSGCRARDAGAINQDIETAKCCALRRKKRFDLPFIGDVGEGCRAGREALLECGQGSSVDVADVDFGARFRESGCNGGSNPRIRPQSPKPATPEGDRCRSWKVILDSPFIEILFG